MDRIEKNKVVEIHYVLRDSEGEILDSTRDEPPMPYLHGGDDLLPGLERALEGRHAGETFRVTVSPEEAYGPYDPEAMLTIPWEDMPEGEEIEVGDELVLEGPEEEDQLDVIVVDLSEAGVRVDLNHPLAGQTLDFEITVGAVRDATSDEIEQGFADDPYDDDEEDEEE